MCIDLLEEENSSSEHLGHILPNSDWSIKEGNRRYREKMLERKAIMVVTAAQIPIKQARRESAHRLQLPRDPTLRAQLKIRAHPGVYPFFEGRMGLRPMFTGLR